MKNFHHFFRFIRFLTFLFLFSLMNGCFLFEEDKESKRIARNKELASVFIPLISNANECLNRSNIIITQGQNIGPYTDRMCFKITINTDTTVIMVTPGTSTGNATVWSSDALHLKRDIYYEDDPTFTIKGPGTWYADVACSSCTSYTISVP